MNQMIKHREKYVASNNHNKGKFTLFTWRKSKHHSLWGAEVQEDHYTKTTQKISGILQVLSKLGFNYKSNGLINFLIRSQIASTWKRKNREPQSSHFSSTVTQVKFVRDHLEKSAVEVKYSVSLAPRIRIQ